MTDLLIRDPNDTGEIPPPDLVDTAVFEVGETTQVIRPYDVDFPALRRPEVDETAEVPLYQPSGLFNGDLDETVHLDFTPKPTGPKPPPRPKPKSWWARLTYRGEHRAARWTR